MATVTVIRFDGRLDMELLVNYTTQDADAVAGMDYEATEVGGPGFWVLDARVVVDEATAGGVQGFGFGTRARWRGWTMRPLRWGVHGVWFWTRAL